MRCQQEFFSGSGRFEAEPLNLQKVRSHRAATGGTRIKNNRGTAVVIFCRGYFLQRTFRPRNIMVQHSTQLRSNATSRQLRSNATSRQLRRNATSRQLLRNATSRQLPRIATTRNKGPPGPRNEGPRAQGPEIKGPRAGPLGPRARPPGPFISGPWALHFWALGAL